MEITLKNNNQGQVSPSVYNPYDPPGSTGATDYRNNIDTCNTTVLKKGDWLTPEPGNMVGPTSQGVGDLVAKDPGAYWDTSCNNGQGCVKGSAFPNGSSPRIGRVPLYDPTIYGQGQQSGKSGPQLQVVNFLGFFIEQVDGGGNVLGRITPIGGLWDNSAGPATGAFPVVIRLVK
jgi:hypothetical protein